MPKPRALIVEDSDEFVILTTTLLEAEGFDVTSVGTAAQGISSARELDPDLVILDITLPDGLGYEVCRTIRTFSDPYVVVVSGRRDEIDKVIGFEVGADDYLTKPFSSRELSARIAAMRRRPRAPRQSHLRTFGDVVVDTASREVSVGGQPVELTRIEFDLLDMLTAYPRRALRDVSRLVPSFDRGREQGRLGDHSFDLVAPEPVIGGEVARRCHTPNVRKKIGESGRAPRHLKTVRDVGFRFDPS